MPTITTPTPSSIQAYRVDTVIPHNGIIELGALPFEAGAVVQIIILGPEKGTNGKHAHLGRLQGTVLKYEDPFEPAEDEWEVEQ